MSEVPSSLETQLLHMRRAFDASFASPLADSPSATSDYISICLGDEPYALALAEIDELQAGVTVVPIPSPIRELKGISFFRGDLIPVYDLPGLLGLSGTSGRWLALIGHRAAALAFDRLDDHFRAEPGAILRDMRPDHGRHLHSVAQLGSRLLPIIDLKSLLAAVRQRATATPGEE